MALDTAKLYLHHIWKNHRLPQMIISDCGPQFTSQIMQDVCKCLRFTSKLSTAHHPQTDGQIEQMDRDLEQYLCMFCAEKQDEWLDWLLIVQFSYNLKISASSKKSSFEVTHSYVCP